MTTEAWVYGVWRKSSLSSGEDNCVEVAPATWHKSSLSSGKPNCIEVAQAAAPVAVRDSKDPDGPILRFAPAEWGAFIDAATHGELRAR